MIIKVPLDLKSLYLNIKNDNKTGHTPTVNTPLRQGSAVHSEVAQILQLAETISQRSKEELSLHLLSKSRAKARINRVYLFDKIMVNGVPIETETSYCIYIREEIDPANVNCGRQKVHYPQVLRFENDELCIDNQSIIKKVSSVLHDYAFIVQAFHIDLQNRILNFDALVVGYGGIPYSKVFMNKRGVGEKFASIFREQADVYDTEIIALREKLGYDAVGPANFHDILEHNKELAIDHVCKYICEKYNCETRNISNLYPSSLFDIEVNNGLAKRYAIVQCTATKICYFALSSRVIRFLNEFSEYVDVYVVINVNSSPEVKYLSLEEINNCKKTISMVTYECRRG